MSTVRTLTKAQLSELERDLRGERARLERMMVAEDAADSLETSGNGAQRAAGPFESEIGLALETRARARLESVLDALRRLEAGTYGVCVACSNPIPYGRLLAMPETARCVTCAARA
ncbi:MAG TPA: TraR/DksA C4-type zinc finger protein [Gemmatimonadaceae bacterium]|nr:TraR/DksA C4-type zinc finger protein [Gemmatimonadaceae bacterium]